MKIKEFIVILIVNVFSLSLLVNTYTFHYPYAAVKLPRVILYALIFFSIIKAIIIITKGELSPLELSLSNFANIQSKKLILTIIATLLYIIAILIFGFFIASIMFIFLIPLILGYRGIRNIIITIIISITFIYLIFIMLLNAQLPKGIFGI